MTPATLYDDAVAAGIQLDSHASDLYLLDGAPTRALLWRHQATRATMFRSQPDGELWWDVPFAFAPFWRRVGRYAGVER